MKINNPVDCRRFFQSQIQENQDQLWCVRLSLSGQILDLACFPEGLPLTKSSISYIFNQPYRPTDFQILMAHIGCHHSQSFDPDLELIDWLLHRTHHSQATGFCDYLVLHKTKTLSLLDMVTF